MESKHTTYYLQLQSYGEAAYFFRWCTSTVHTHSVPCCRGAHEKSEVTTQALSMANFLCAQREYASSTVAV